MKDLKERYCSIFVNVFIITNNNLQKLLYHTIIVGIKQNLRIIICLEVGNNQLSHIYRCFPAIYQNSCTIWIREWNKATMEKIPQMIAEKYFNLAIY